MIISRPETNQDRETSQNREGAAALAERFDPVPVRARHDGWTAERQRGFIEKLAVSGCVSAAARSVGMSVESVYRLRHRADAETFNAAWKAALAMASQRLVDIAFERAVEGVAEPVFHKGEVVGEKRRYSTALLMYLLRYNEPAHYGVLAKVSHIYVPDPNKGRGDLFRRLLGRVGRGFQPAPGEKQNTAK